MNLRPRRLLAALSAVTIAASTVTLTAANTTAYAGAPVATAAGHGFSFGDTSGDVAAPTEPSNPSGNIVGGIPATQTYPWMARLSMGCGGTMLSRDIILTAQHCMGSGTVGANIGSNYYPSGVYRSSAAIRTGSGIPNADWAVIKLSQPYDVPGGYPVLPVGTGYDNGPTYRALGWGYMREGGTGVTDLRQVELPFVSDSLCNTGASEICAGDYNNGGIDTCQGDSGGPLLKQVGSMWVQVGITSWGNGCARAGEPGHYAQVSTFTNAIQNAIAALGGQPATTTAGGGPTSTPTSTPTTSPGGGTLTNGVPVTVSGATGSFATWSIDVPAGASNLVISSSGGSGDMDLYVKAGSAPTKSIYDCRSWAYGSTESCSVAAPQATRYYIGLSGYSSFSGVTLRASYTSGGGSTPTTGPTTSPGGTLGNGIPVTVSGASGSKTYYAINVPSGASSLTVSSSGGSGDMDLYLKRGSQPTTTSYDCRSWNGGSTETCRVSYPTSGTYYVMLNGYTSFSGVSVVARW